MTAMRVPDPVQHAIAGIEGSARIGAIGRTLVRLVRPVADGAAGPVLRGDWLGHALHPLLTDIPIGCWTSSFLLDVAGGRRSRPAAQRLIGLGLLAVAPTAASGAVDWHDTEGEERRRVGVVHAVSNSLAAGAYFASWLARRRGRYGVGVLLAGIGGTAATVGGYLGGHLAFGTDERDTLGPEAHALDGKIGA